MRSGYWQELTTRDFEHFDVERTIAVFPVAAIEQHGPHLPLATDALINAGIVRSTLPRLPDDLIAVFLPPFDYGTSAEHSDFAGTLSVEPTVLLEAWKSLLKGVAATGIRKLVILNSHGGQKQLVDLLALHLRVAHHMLAVRCNYFAFGAPKGLFPTEEWSTGIHGGEVETSLLLHLNPELVHTGRLHNFESVGTALAERNSWLGVEKPIGFGWKAEDLNPAGVVGNAAAADTERGAAYLEHIGRSLAELIAEVAATPLGMITDKR